jgi:AraC-like DNA-binding protein
MIACGTASFTDPDEYGARIPWASINLVLNGRGDFKATLTWVKLNRLNLVRVEENLPRIGFLTLAPGSMVIAFPIRNHLPMLWNGRDLELGAIVLHGKQGDRIYQRIDGPCRWGLLSLTPKDLAGYGQALAHVNLRSPSSPQFLRPPSVLAADLRRLHAEACRLAETKPEAIAHKEIARALEQHLFHALINCLVGEGMRRDRGARQRQAEVMARFENVLASHCYRHMPMPEVCAAVGASERTLRLCCAQFLHMSPLNYARLRRLNLVRSMLTRVEPATATIASIARRHGFSELGRFATHYRSVFGETPSTTLRGHRTSGRDSGRTVELA